jgi:hypothetical protein
MADIKEWLQETEARATLISEAYRLELSRLWWANLMFVVVPAVLSTAAAIFAALPQETAGSVHIGALSLPLASIFAGVAAILLRRSSATSIRPSASGSVKSIRA